MKISIYGEFFQAILDVADVALIVVRQKLKSNLENIIKHK
jgi:hypothetical protein